MTRPLLYWKGEVESQCGTATFICGNMKEDMQLPTFECAKLIEKLFEKAWIDGVDDGQENMERNVFASIKRCKSSW